MSNLQIKISNPEVLHKGKQTKIKIFLGHCSRVNMYSFSVDGDTLTVSPILKSQEAYNRIHSGITEILDDNCEQLDDSGNGCSEHYNCCDCGGSGCGCRGCFSCNACDSCLNDD